MKLDVYDSSNITLLGTLAEPFGVEFLDDLTIPGFARFQLDTASTADLALCQPRRVVRFRTGASPGAGDVFAAIIQDRPAVLNDQVQPTGGLSTVTVECRGLLAWLGAKEGGAVMWPYGGLDGRQQNPRVFGWQAPDFDDFFWEDVTGQHVGPPLSTPGWPDPQAAAIEPPFRGDRAFYRRSLPAVAGAEGPARMFLVATVGSQVTVFLDGDEVLSKPVGQSGLFYADVPYESIDHLVAVEVSGGTGRWGWTWMRLVATSEADILDWQRLTFDDAGWDGPEVDDVPLLANRQGAWSATVEYATNDLVTHAGETWVATGATEEGDEPGVAAVWVESFRIVTSGWPDEDAIAYRIPAGGRWWRRFVPGDTHGTSRMFLVATSYSSVTVFLDGDEILSKPQGTSGIVEAEVAYPTGDAQLSVLTEGEGRFALVWREGSAGDGATLFTTYDPAVASPSNPWLTVVVPSGEQEFQLGQVLRRTYNPVLFPDATPWRAWWGPALRDLVRRDVDDSSWAAPIPDGPLSTSGWPDSAATAFQSRGRSVFRRLMVSASEGEPATMTVAAEVGLSVRVFLDGTQVLHKPSGRRGLFTADVAYPDVDTQLAVIVTGTGRWGWTWQTAGGTTLRRTFDPIQFPSADEPWRWQVDEEPGVTSGFVLDRALAEDFGRHAGRPWSWSFDGQAGSDGVDWQVRFSRGFRVQEVGLLLDELTSVEGEPEMTPLGEFRFVRRRGSDKASSVTVSSPFALQLSGRGPQATRWLYETQGGFGTAVNAQVEDDLGVVMERFVQLGSDLTTDSIAGVVGRLLDEDAGVLDEVDVDLPDGVTPYDTVVLGDTVTCVGRDGSVPVRLTSFSGVVDDASGFVVWSATGVPDGSA